MWIRQGVEDEVEHCLLYCVACCADSEAYLTDHVCVPGTGQAGTAIPAFAEQRMAFAARGKTKFIEAIVSLSQGKCKT